MNRSGLSRKPVLAIGPLGVNSIVRCVTVSYRLGIVKAIKTVISDEGISVTKYGILWDHFYCVLLHVRNEFIHVHQSEFNKARPPYMVNHGKCMILENNKRVEQIRAKFRADIEAEQTELFEQLKMIPFYRDIIESSARERVKIDQEKLRNIEKNNAKRSREADDNPEATEETDITEDPRFKQMYVNGADVIRKSYSYYDHPSREDFSTCSPVKCVR
jgi:hypothetical protein